MTCRDGRETNLATRGGTRLAQEIVKCSKNHAVTRMQIRGVKCMSQCKRPCIVSLTAQNQFTYIFGDLDPDENVHVEALFELAARYENSTEGFLERKDRPKVLQANILGRLPPLGSQSELVTDIKVLDP
jgi:predicted metal-binding protein